MLFRSDQPSVAAGLVFFGLLYSPIDLVLSFFMQAFSRKNEFEADAFARETTGSGERLAIALKRLGPTYIKLGQILSTRADLIGEDAAADLSALQDQLEPFDDRTARRILAEALARPVEDVFADFGPAFSAASVAQVHFATLHGGEIGRAHV